MYDSRIGGMDVERIKREARKERKKEEETERIGG